MHHGLEMVKRNRPAHIHKGDNTGDNNDYAVDFTGSASIVNYYTSMLKNYDKTQLIRKIYAKPTKQL